MVDVSTLRFTNATLEPFVRISMDTVGPLPADTEGYKFVLVIIDCFTRVIELYKCRTTEAAEAAFHLIDFISRYGTPEEVLSDRGTQFVNATIDSALQTLGVQHLLSLARSKEENAIVERSIKEVLRHLIPMVYDSKIVEYWSRYLPLVRRIYMAHPHESTGVAPAQLLYGLSVNLDRGLFPDGDDVANVEGEKRAEEQDTPAKPAPKRRRKSNKQDAHTGTTEEEVKQWLDAQRVLLQRAKEWQTRLDTENVRKRTAENAEALTEFAPGEYILVAQPNSDFGGRRPASKLAMRKRGPFRVVEQIGNTVRIQDLSHDHVEEVHVTQLVPFRYDEGRTDPFEVSLTDNYEFQVETIVGHAQEEHDGQSVRNPKLTLEIRWKELPPERTTWEPVGNMVHLPLVRDYLVEHDLKQYLPRSMKDKPDINPRPRLRRKPKPVRAKEVPQQRAPNSRRSKGAARAATA